MSYAPDQNSSSQDFWGNFAYFFLPNFGKIWVKIGEIWLKQENSWPDEVCQKN